MLALQGKAPKPVAEKMVELRQEVQQLYDVGIDYSEFWEHVDAVDKLLDILTKEFDKLKVTKDLETRALIHRMHKAIEEVRAREEEYVLFVVHMDI